jgi:small membrane protein
MKLIQVLLLFLLFLIALSISQVLKNKLFYRVIFLLGVLIALIMVLYPDLTAEIAHIVGVGRGVDLLFYSLFIVLSFVLIIMYRRILKLDDMLTLLARQQAIQDANDLSKKPA